MTQECSVPRASLESRRCLSSVAGATIQWDGRRGVYHEVQTQTCTEPALPSSFWRQRAATTGAHPPYYWATGEIHLAPGVLHQAIAWEQEATLLTFALNATLLGDHAEGEFPSVTGELVWLRRQEQTDSATLSVSPVLLGRIPTEVHGAASVTIVPFLRAGDPLLKHIALVLQTTIDAKDKSQQLYAGSLATALVRHFLRRYAITRGTPENQGAGSHGLVPYKLQRTLAYIEAHLEQCLSLTTLAAIVQMSPSHFAHLFKESTGLAPRQYVTVCRIKYAKQLLSETTLPLIEIGYRVGCADPSHFSALFRQQTGLSPSAYRRTMSEA